MNHIRNMLMSQVSGLEDLDAGEVKEIAEKTATEVAELVADKAAEEVKAEVNELADEVEEISEEVEEISEDVEELEECVDGMESLLQAGAYNAAAFGLLYNRAEKLHNKLGGAETGSVVGAESLGDATSAALAARSGLEGFAETVKGYKDSAVKFIVTMWNAAINYVKGLLDKSVAIENQVKTTTERLNKAEELKTEVKAGKWTGMSRMHNTDKLAHLVQNAGGLVDGAAKLAENDVPAYKMRYSALKSSIEALGAGMESKKSKNGENTTHTFKMGSVTISATVFDGEISDMAGVSKAAKATRLSFSVDKTVPEKYQALNKSACGTMLQEAAKAGGELAKLKESKAGNEKGRDELVAQLKKLDGKTEEWVKPAISAIKASTAMTNSVFTVASRIMGAVADAKIAAVKAHL